MARAFTPQDCHAIVNAIQAELSGQQSSIQSVNSSNFVSVGETILSSYPMENVYNALGLVMGRTLIAVRPYSAKLMLINAMNTGMYTTRMRKISYYDRPALASGDFNTQLFTNLQDGYDNGENPNGGGVAQSTKDQWEQHQTYPVNVFFGGSSVMEFCLTFYEDQVKNAFRGEEEFAAFWSGALMEYANQIEQRKEAFNRMTLLNFMAGIYDLQSDGTLAINLTTAYNAKYNAGGTPDTTAALLSTKYDSFLKFMTAEIKKWSKRLTNRSVKAHVTPPKTDAAGNNLALLRHTPKNKQRLFLYEPMFVDAQAEVLPTIFNPEMLSIENYEGVDFWQNETESESMKISWTPAVPDFTTGLQTTGNAVALDNVVGLLFDEDALMVDYQLETANSTPLEARKRYRNTWLSIARNSINDFTENAILFYMAD